MKCIIFLVEIERNNHELNLAESGVSDDFRIRISSFKVDAIYELKELALGEEDKSLKSTANYIYLLYCNIVINNAVSAIVKVNGVFVLYLKHSKKLC